MLPLAPSFYILKVAAHDQNKILVPVMSTMLGSEHALHDQRPDPNC